jgi:hypothetical protein
MLGPEFEKCKSKIGAPVHESFELEKYAKHFPGKSKSGAMSYKMFEEAIADSGYVIDS